MSDHELYQDALEVLILTAIVAKEARHDVEQRLKGYGAEMTALQYRVLRQLEQGRFTLKALSGSLMVEPATLVPVIDTLERQGLIRRGRDPRDRRRIPLELTDEGAERLGRIPYVHEDDVIATYLRRLADDERSAFLQHLRDLVMTIHGDGETVRRITEAVNGYFAFGEQQESSQESSQESRPKKRGARHPSQPSSEESSS